MPSLSCPYDPYLTRPLLSTRRFRRLLRYFLLLASFPLRVIELYVIVEIQMYLLLPRLVVECTILIEVMYFLLLGLSASSSAGMLVNLRCSHVKLLTHDSL